MKSVANIVSVTCSQLKISLYIRLQRAGYNIVQKGGEQHGVSQSSNCFSLFKTFFMPTFCLQFFWQRSLALHKKLLCINKILFTISCTGKKWLRKKLCSMTIKKLCYTHTHTQKDSCRFKIFCVAQERNACKKNSVV